MIIFDDEALPRGSLGMIYRQMAFENDTQSLQCELHTQMNSINHSIFA